MRVPRRDRLDQRGKAFGCSGARRLRRGRCDRPNLGHRRRHRRGADDRRRRVDRRHRLARLESAQQLTRIGQAGWRGQRAAAPSRPPRSASRRVSTSVMPLEQQLPQPVQRRRRPACPPSRPAPRAPRPTAPGSARAADLGTGDAVHRLQQPAEQRRRIDAERMLLLAARRAPPARRPPAAARTVAHRAAIGQAEHLAHRRRRDAARSAPACAIAWSRIDRPSRADPSAARAISASASGSASTPSGLDDMREMRREHVRRNAAQVEALAARQHRHRHLVHLGRGEQELHVRRRLFERLQQRVERVLRQHVDFVDDVDLVARRDRRVAHRLDDLAHVVDAGVAARRPSRSRRYGGLRRSRCTARTRRTGSIVGPPCPSGPMQLSALAISRAVRGLAHPAHAGQQEGVRQPPAPDRVAQRLDHRVLPDQLGKTLRPVFARKHAIGCGGFAHALSLPARVRQCRGSSAPVHQSCERVGAGTTRHEIVAAASFRT